MLCIRRLSWRISQPLDNKYSEPRNEKHYRLRPRRNVGGRNRRYGTPRSAGSAAAQFCERWRRHGTCTLRRWESMSNDAGVKGWPQPAQPDTPTSRPTATITTFLGRAAWTLRIGLRKKPAVCCPDAAALAKANRHWIEVRCIHVLRAFVSSW